MQWVIRAAVALFFCFVFFGAIQHYLELDRWMSTVLSVILAVFTTLVATFDFVKKWYDARKGPYELRKLKSEEEAAERAKNSVIKTPDADELKKHGQSSVERMLEQRYRNEGPDALKPKRFVVDSSEKKI
jgi:hypothetical protein